MNTNYIFLFFILIIYRVSSKECCHFGNIVLSSGYCKENNLKFIKIGNSSLSSPCDKSSETLSWGYQSLSYNSSYSLFECQSIDNEEIYHQIGGCGENGIVKKENKIIFSNYEQFFASLSCIKEKGTNSYGYVVSSSIESLENAIYSYKSVCYQTGGSYYLYDIWQYGNDIDCFSDSTSTSTCICSKNSNIIDGSCKTSYPYSIIASSSHLNSGRIDPICNGRRCGYRRVNNRNKLKWMIPTIIFSAIGGLLLLFGLIYLIKKSRDNEFHSPLLG